MFRTFAEEKEHRRTNRCMGSAWGKISPPNTMDGIDPDILPFIGIINGRPDTYSKGMSCSGSFQDHQRYLMHVNDYGVDRSRNQGYAILRVDSAHPKFPLLETILTLVPDSSLGPIGNEDPDDEQQQQQNIVTLAYQIFVPDAVQVPGHEHHETYMTRIWQNLALAIMSGNPKYISAITQEFS
jgi:hypothetical protein